MYMFNSRLFKKNIRCTSNAHDIYTKVNTYFLCWINTANELKLTRQHYTM